jgi:hypothetical protein
MEGILVRSVCFEYIQPRPYFIRMALYRKRKGDNTPNLLIIRFCSSYNYVVLMLQKLNVDSNLAI